MRQRISRTLTLAALVVFPIASGCGPNEPDPAEAVARAGRQLDLGNTQGALDILQAYEERKPGNPQVVEQLAFAWSQKGDLRMAAHFFQKLAELRPDQPDALLFAAQSLQQAGDAEGAMVTYQQYLAKKPDDVGACMTFASIAAANGRTDAAIGQYTYVYGIKPSADVALSLGTLYLKKADMQQAALWFERAKAEKPQEYSLGMLEVAMRSQNYPRAENLIAQIKNAYPGVLEASALKDAPATIDRWHEKIAEEKKASAAATLQAGKQEKAETPKSAEASSPAEVVIIPVESVERVESDGYLSKKAAVAIEEAREQHDESLVVTQAQAAEAAITPLPDDAANIVAKTAEEIPPVPLAAPVVITPAEPKTEPLSIPLPSTPSPESVTGVRKSVPPPIAKAVPTNIPPAVAHPEPPSMADTLDEARKTAMAGKLEEAARLYQTVLAKRPSAVAWNEFSVLSVNMGRPGQAMAASLEATRIDPFNLDYAIQYLSVVEKVYDQRRVMSELLVMRKRFPESPVIALALARAYWQVDGNAGMARYYYDQYLNRAPKSSSAYMEILAERDALPMP